VASNPFAQYKKGGNPFAVYKTPGTGPKAPTGFAAPGSAPAVAPIQGGPQDLKYIGDAEAARVAAAQSIQNRYEMQQIQAREAAQAALQARNNQLPASPNQKFDNVSGLRKELEGQDAVKTYKNALPSYASALRSPDTPAGDQDLIYAFAKIMDPNSVVREGEAATASALGTMGEQMAGAVRKQLAAEGKLTPEIRAMMRNTLAGRVAAYDKAYNFERGRFRELSTKQGIDPDLVVGPHIGDAYAAIENQYFRHDPNKSAAAVRAEQANGGNGGGDMPLVLPGATTATGATKATQMDPKTAALMNTLIGQGYTAEQINKIMVPAGMIGPAGLKQQDVDKAFKYLKAGGKISPQYEEPTTQWNRVVDSPVGTGIGAAADAGAFGLSDEIAGMADWAKGKGSLSDMIAMENARKTGAFDAHPRASTIGSIAGGLTDLAGGGALTDLARVPGMTRMFAGRGAQKALPLMGDAAYGAAYGAGNNNDNRVLGLAAGAAGGAAGSFIGNKATKAVGGMVGGVKNAAIDYLKTAGVPMTGGQMLGGGWKSLEDKLTSIPLVGDIIKNRRAEGYNAFNQAAFDQAGKPISASIPAIGDMGLHRLDQRIGDAYSNALDGVSVNADPQFVSEFQNVIGQGKALPGQMADNADYTLRTRVGDSIAPNGDITGNNYQQALRGLRRDTRGLADQPYGYDFGQVTGGAEHALDGLLDRQAPGVVPAKKAADQTYRNYLTIEDAVKSAKNQIGDHGNVIFTPAQLNAASVRKGGMAFNRPLKDLAEAGQQVLPSKVPDSGTAGRAAVGLLAATAGGGATGGGAGYMAGDTGAGTGFGAGLGLLAGGLNTRFGQKALTKLLLERPEFARKLSDWVIDQAPAGGHFGASLGATAGGPAIISRLSGGF
jgi:hypothetical protein